ncbi:MAG: efflux RND transporter periplasmic adaptor subunit [Deltaproteobacteria bacterium]
MIRLAAFSRRCFAYLLFVALCLPAGSAQSEPQAQVQTQPLTEHTLKQTVLAYGQVQPDPEHISSISLPQAGMVSRLLVRVGERVVADQELLELDTAPKVRMDYQQAKAAVDYARNKLDQTERLLSQQLATRDQVSSARRNLEDAKAKLKALQKLGSQKKEVIVRAPFAGIITQLKVSQGQRVQADTDAVLLASGNTLIVPLGVEPEDARRVKPGMEVVLESLFEESLHVGVEVTSVLAMVNPATRLVDVLTRVPDSKSAPLVIGSRIKGTITLSQVRALAVPRSAVLRDEQGAYLFVVREGRAHRVNVRTGIEAGDLVAVSGPLKIGEAVVTVGNYELKDGMVVQEVGG